MRPGAHSAGEFAHGGDLARYLDAFQSALEFVIHQRHF